MGRAAMPHPSYMGSLHASPATPRYSPGADGYMEGLATAPAAQGMMPPLPYTSPGSAAAVAATSSLHPSHRGNQMLPAYRVGNSPFDVHYGIPHPGVVPQGEPQSVYMYFATGGRRGARDQTAEHLWLHLNMLITTAGNLAA